MATMRLWRCQSEGCSEDAHGRLIYDFPSETGVCPKCKTDPNTPEGKEVVIPLVCMHLVVKDPAGPIVTGKGRLMVACQPETTKLPTRATGVPSATTCPVCKESEAYKKAHYETRPLDESEVPAIGTKLVG